MSWQNTRLLAFEFAHAATPGVLHLVRQDKRKKKSMNLRSTQRWARPQAFHWALSHRGYKSETLRSVQGSLSAWQRRRTCGVRTEGKIKERGRGKHEEREEDRL